MVSVTQLPTDILIQASSLISQNTTFRLAAIVLILQRLVLEGCIMFVWGDRCLRFEGVEDCRLHDVVPAGEFLQTILLDFPIIFSFNISVLLKDARIYAFVMFALFSFSVLRSGNRLEMGKEDWQVTKWASSDLTHVKTRLQLNTISSIYQNADYSLI